MSSGEREWWWWIFIYVIDGFDECTVCVRNNYHFWRYFHAINLLHLDLHLHYGPKDSPHNFPTFFLFLFFYLFLRLWRGFSFRPEGKLSRLFKAAVTSKSCTIWTALPSSIFLSPLLWFDISYAAPPREAKKEIRRIFLNETRRSFSFSNCFLAARNI